MKRISILLLVIVTALASCKKVPEVNKEYVDVERDLITVGTTTATIQCDYEYIATLKKAYLYYGEGEDATDMISAEMRVVQNTLYVDLSGLKENTTYSYYYEFVNGFNSMKSAVKVFKTEASPTTVTLPTVVTAEVTEMTANSAKGGGEVTNDGGAEVTERGICWSTNANPTLSDSHVAAGTGTGAFTASMSGLEANTTYHVRAYAINEKGTAYGLDREFVTSGGGSNIHEGALSGMFSVAPDRWVRFSKGNLQYQASTNIWRFAENQWDFVGGYNNGDCSVEREFGNVYESGNKCSNDSASSTYSGWIDLFGYGTSGWNSGAVCYQPWSRSRTDSDYLLGGNANNQMIGEWRQADWGVYNSIVNGGNAADLWRTLTYSEWDYLLTKRQGANEKVALGTVNGYKGCILLPDSFIVPSMLSFAPGVENNYETNVYSVSEWYEMERVGAVFLTCAGFYFNRYIHYNQCADGYHDDFGQYWLATTGGASGNVSGIVLGLTQWTCSYCVSSGNTTRVWCYSVRLVQDDNP